MCLEIEARAARKFSEFTTINDSFSYSEVLRNVKFSEATTSRKNLQVEDFPEALNLEFFSPGDSQPGVFEKTPGSNLKKTHWHHPNVTISDTNTAYEVPTYFVSGVRGAKTPTGVTGSFRTGRARGCRHWGSDSTIQCHEGGYLRTTATGGSINMGNTSKI